ncbi:hypothetical protein SDC9_122592 [bioreactor metagenome]|uniref:Uncharacterized protein n=1 Tax=bioreactor metagenome TaxID=1076179 RepID=A0A645CFC5_9ZZZZ
MLMIDRGAVGRYQSDRVEDVLHAKRCDKRRQFHLGDDEPVEVPREDRSTHRKRKRNANRQAFLHQHDPNDRHHIK